MCIGQSKHEIPDADAKLSLKAFACFLQENSDHRPTEWNGIKANGRRNHGLLRWETTTIKLKNPNTSNDSTINSSSIGGTGTSSVRNTTTTGEREFLALLPAFQCKIGSDIYTDKYYKLNSLLQPNTEEHQPFFVF